MRADTRAADSHGSDHDLKTQTSIITHLLSVSFQLKNDPRKKMKTLSALHSLVQRRRKAEEDQTEITCRLGKVREKKICERDTWDGILRNLNFCITFCPINNVSGEGGEQCAGAAAHLPMLHL